MDLSVGLLTLLHMLVFVYWLGGDLGVFYSSYILVDASKPLPARLTALKVLNNVDMAPRTALVLAVPTGVTLAWAKGWIAMPGLALIGIWLAGLVWLALVWRIHLKHLPPNDWSRRFDISLRWVLMLGFAGTGIGVVAGIVPGLPLFIGAKLLVFSIIILLGLLIRGALRPLFGAVRDMIANGPTPETDRIIRHVILWRTKPAVVCIWIMTCAAALLGIMHPL